MADPARVSESAANGACIRSLYESFQRRNGAAMAACYHPDASFSDPVFTGLRGPEVGAMWAMLCERAREFELLFSDVWADERRGGARWEARYTFSATGRRVHNVIQARFRFRDGLIIQHQDRFSLWKWSAMALGPAGALFGWSPPVRSGIRRKAAAGLRLYMEQKGNSHQGARPDHDGGGAMERDETGGGGP